MGMPGSRYACATFRPSAVWVSTSTLAFWCQWRMVCSRSAWVLRPDTKPHAAAFAKASVPARSNSPVSPSCCHSALTRSASPPCRSKTKRSKLDALEMSIDGLEVAWVSRALRTR